MVMVHLHLDSRPIAVPTGTTIWEAARRHGIDIPALCHSPRLQPVGVCRMCVVDVGGRALAASCVRPCEEGMKVETASERVETGSPSRRDRSARRVPAARRARGIESWRGG